VAGPAWYFNVKAHPAITVQDGDKVVELTAREVEGVEREQWWELAVAAYPPYAEYQTKTARLIPVFVLEYASGPAPAVHFFSSPLSTPLATYPIAAGRGNQPPEGSVM
jgi:hypothetical protein